MQLWRLGILKSFDADFNGLLMDMNDSFLACSVVVYIYIYIYIEIYMYIYLFIDIYIWVWYFHGLTGTPCPLKDSNVLTHLYV